MTKGSLIGIIIATACLAPGHAALEIEVSEVDVGFGTDVLFSWSGSLDTSGVVWFTTSGTSISGGVHPSNGGFFGYDSGGSTIDLSQPGTLTPGTIPFGTGTFAASTTSSGMPFGLDGAGRIGMPAGYLSGSPLTGEIRFPNNNLLSLGIDLSSGPVVWNMPSGDTITLSKPAEITVSVDFESIGSVGEVVPPFTQGDLTVTITDTLGDDQEPRIAEYGDDQFFGFAGDEPGVPATPTAVTSSRYLCSAPNTSGGAFAFTTMEFSFSAPVKSFTLSTIDMVESVNAATPLVLTALAADDSEVAQTIVESPPSSENGVVFTFEVASTQNDIHRVRFEGPPTGHGIDDLVIIRDEDNSPPPPSPLKIISPPPGWDSVTIQDMSNDGTRLVGRLLRSADFTYQAFLWTEEDGYTLLEGLPGTNADSIAGISGDGNVVLGWTPSDSDPNENLSWAHRSGATSPVSWIGGTEYNLATELSTDGSVLVGQTDVDLAPTTFANRPAIWSWNGSNYTGTSLPSVWPSIPAFQNLGWLETISGDGRYVFGKHAVSSFPATYNSYRFDRVDGSIDHLSFPTNLSMVQSNQDGSVVLLQRDRSYAYLWKPGGDLEQLENRPSEGLTGYSYRAIGMSEDAKRIFAYEDRFSFGSLLGTRLVFWQEDRELRDFVEMLGTQGIDLTGWTINELDAVSSDGTILAGEALVDGAKVGFLLTLPEGPLDADPLEALLTGPDGFFEPGDGPEITGLDADPDNDGIPNIMEIALANFVDETVIPCDPTQSSNRPTTEVEVDNPEEPAINLTVVRRHDVPGLNVGMAISTEIDGEWSTEGVTETVTLIDDTWELVTFNAPTGGQKQFARLVVNYSP